MIMNSLNDVTNIGLNIMFEKVSFNTFQINPICIIYNILKDIIDNVNAR